MVLIGQKTLGEKLGIDVMAHLKAFVLKPGHQDSARMETTARAVNETNAGAVLRAAMAVTAFGPSDDAPGDADDDVMLTMLPQRPTMFQDSVVEMLDRVEALETATDYAVDHSLTLGCAKMLHDIVYRTHLDVFRRALLGHRNCWGDLLSQWVTRLGGPVCMHPSVKYTKVLFAGSDKFSDEGRCARRAGGRCGR